MTTQSVREYSQAETCTLETISVQSASILHDKTTLSTLLPITMH